MDVTFNTCLHNIRSACPGSHNDQVFLCQQYELKSTLEQIESIVSLCTLGLPKEVERRSFLASLDDDRRNTLLRAYFIRQRHPWEADSIGTREETAAELVAQLVRETASPTPRNFANLNYYVKLLHSYPDLDSVETTAAVEKAVALVGKAVALIKAEGETDEEYMKMEHLYDIFGTGGVLKPEIEAAAAKFGEDVIARCAAPTAVCGKRDREVFAAMNSRAARSGE